MLWPACLRKRGAEKAPFFCFWEMAKSLFISMHFRMVSLKVYSIKYPWRQLTEDGLPEIDVLGIV